MPLLVYLWKGAPRAPFHLIVLGALISVTFDGVGILVIKMGYYNVPLINAFSILEFAISCLIFVQLLELKNQKLIGWGLIALVTLGVGAEVYYKGWFIYANYSAFVVGILIVLLAILYFFKLMREMKVDNLFQDPGFLYSSACIVFFGSTAILYLFQALLPKKGIEVFNLAWHIHSVFYILYQLILAYAVKCSHKTPPSSFSS